MSPLSKVHFISPAVNHISGLESAMIIYHLFYLNALLVADRVSMFLFVSVGFEIYCETEEHPSGLAQ